MTSSPTDTTHTIASRRDDFPIEWERDTYITRREMLKFLTLGSGLLAGANLLVATAGKWLWQSRSDGPRAVIARTAAIPKGGSLLFSYPTEQDRCILIRDAKGDLHAYSQVCTHLSCAVVHRPDSDGLFCPCHHGWFDAATGRPTAGPPTRRLPRIRLSIEGDNIVAVGREA